jgi:histidinol-phosphate/aromatic aminotransferase/cobyric acid decarboxylase-like protein
LHSADEWTRDHGGLLEREIDALGLTAEEVLDVSVNVNPYGPCLAVADAVRLAPIDRYPDPTAWRARQAIARSIGSIPQCVVLGNGAVDLLWTLARTELSSGQSALIVEPAFSEFRAAVEAVGARALSWRAHAEASFSIDLDAAAQAAAHGQAGLVYLATPANPTGVLVPHGEIDRFARRVPNALVVLDESFLALSEGAASEREPLPENVVRLRSMTKTHALAGVRIGYLVAREEVAARVRRAQPPWTTGAAAQAAVCAAVDQQAFVDASRARVLADRSRLTRAARERGLQPVGSSTFFFLLPVRDSAKARVHWLQRHRVLVRDAASFGLPGFVRVCARPAVDDARLLAALCDEATP